ncbi:MAG TPA: pyridoxal-phosphate dependent enzyme [Polyangiaceae bacterium]|nr:pyridoxal-phosphate dependent enzyme [Polyangiaceae bacterium]
MPSEKRRPLFEIWPELEPRLGFLALGDFPTPIEPLARLSGADARFAADTYVKRDDLSSPLYGGNKVRTLEALLGQARRDERSVVFATGAYGSNHAVATALHAQRAGFRTGVALFPQPRSETAIANLRVSLTQADEIVDLPHWSLLPWFMWRRTRGGRAGATRSFIMPPGGAIPRGCLGFLSAGLELAQQVERGLMPPPEEVVIALGSTCSTAGLLVGLKLAARLGLGWGQSAQGARPGRRADGAPLLVAVRVTPWPVTSVFRVVSLALRVSSWLASLTGSPLFQLSRAELSEGLSVDGSQLGPGYGRPTVAGLAAIERLGPFAAALDTTYAAKSAAGLLARNERRPAVRLFWSTKSSVPLPPVPADRLARAPARMRRWLERGGGFDASSPPSR